MKRPATSAGVFLLLAVLCADAPHAARQQNGAPLTPDAIRALLARVISSQHRNDEALMLYERHERRVTRKQEEKTAADEDKLFRVAPTGTGTLKLILEEQGRRVTEENYRQQLRHLEQALDWALDPKESKQKQRVNKWNRRAKERYDLVEAVREAFTCAWGGREARNGGAPLIKLNCSPNPAFKPRTRAEEMFQRSRATLWLDEQASQLVRVEASLTGDLSVGAGVVGKVYSGGRFVTEQAEVAPGVWLPTRFQYDFRGRRFVFGFELHELTTATNYKRIGPPAEALAAVRAEINSYASAGPAKP